LYLHELCQKVKICFFRQESCIEGMTKESWLITQKNKNLERTMSRSSTSAMSRTSWLYLLMISSCYVSPVHRPALFLWAGSMGQLFFCERGTLISSFYMSRIRLSTIAFCIYR
jgi:hypothetical protein